MANSEASWNRMVDLPQPPRRLANATLRAGMVHWHLFQVLSRGLS